MISANTNWILRDVERLRIFSDTLEKISKEIILLDGDLSAISDVQWVHISMRVEFEKLCARYFRSR